MRRVVRIGAIGNQARRDRCDRRRVPAIQFVERVGVTSSDEAQQRLVGKRRYFLAPRSPQAT